VRSRIVAYGYRVGEVILPLNFTVDPTATCGPVREVDLQRRPCVQVDLGPHWKGVALPHPDRLDPMTTLIGTGKRFAVKPPEAKTEVVAALREFVKSYIRKNYVPLPADSDTSLDNWLESTNYPLRRKDELKEKWSRTNFSEVRHNKKYHVCKSFMKDETYTEYKHARGINSRTDEFKCAVGPIFKLIEKEVFKSDHFIKKVPVASRPKYIYDKLYRSGSKYAVSDYTTFEALFVPEIMDAVEFELYEYMTSELPEGHQFMDLIRTAMLGRNQCQYKNFTIGVDGKRMSGEMCTSLGNGFSNLMFMLFMLDRNGCENVDGVVEGDDGLFVFDGRAPTSKQFEDLGLIIKLEIIEDLARASFCGLVFDLFDLINVTDPRVVLASTAWTSERYVKARAKKLMVLLRCKALSMAHQYPGCPILSSYAHYILRLTRSYDIRHYVYEGYMNEWERSQLIDALKDERKIHKIDPPDNTRRLVFELYGISERDQKHIEDWFDNCQSLQPFDIPCLRKYKNPVWEHYYYNYVSDRGWYDQPYTSWSINPAWTMRNPFNGRR
jgi:hypothetical protein